MRFLRATIRGEYIDAFLYRGHLYLLRPNSSLQIINWDAVASRVYQGPDGDIDPLAELVMTNNSLARQDKRILRWSVYDDLREMFLRRLQDYIDFEISPTASESREVDLNGVVAHSIELYYSHVWLVGENGIHVMQCGPGYAGRADRSRITSITNHRTFAVIPERRFLWVCEPLCTIGFPIEDIASRRVTVTLGQPWELDFASLGVGWHWSDPALVARDNWRTKVFVRSPWCDRVENESEYESGYYRTEDETTRHRKEKALSTQIGDPVFVGRGRSFIEVDPGPARDGRLFCSRERAILQHDGERLDPYQWSYDLEFSQENLSQYSSVDSGVERILISTFGWLLERSDQIDVVTKWGRLNLATDEVIQVRVFPSSIRYENIILLIHDDLVEIIALLDYDFTVSPSERLPSVGRNSEFYARRKGDPDYSDFRPSRFR